MNTMLAPRPVPASLRRPPCDRALVADWRDFLFVHYSLPVEVLAPHVPYELDRFEGSAFVSLVYFRLERMRPAWGGGFGATFFRPISNHPFLNLRTYVTHGADDGICFLAEWIPNRLSERIGPLTYGLPYRHGEFASETNRDNGVGRLQLTDPAAGATLGIAYPTASGEGRPCAAGTADAFLLERYRAYTFRGPSRRTFVVDHAPWHVRPVDWIRIDTALIARVFPWFAEATFHSAHVSPGVTDVGMGWPHRVR